MNRQETQAFLDAFLKMRDALTDQQASMAVVIHPSLKGNGELIKAGTRIKYNNIIYKAAVDMWDTAENAPNNAPTLWEVLNYKDGYRIIPKVLTVTTAFVKDECGWWEDVLYKSLIDNNVYTPAEYAAGWAIVK
jgi:hypothetical protein